MYMMQRDEKMQYELREDELKNNVFANSPQLYDKLFGEGSQYVPEEELEHVVPDSTSDFNKLMRELKQVGIID